MAPLEGTQIMGDIWKRDLAIDHIKGANPFDAFMEKAWSDLWLFYTNSVRFASAMGGECGFFAEGGCHATKSIAGVGGLAGTKEIFEKVTSTPKL